MGHAPGPVGDIVLRVRLPRVLAGFACGGLLALAGALLQVLLRNPLADPYVLGISGGAGLGLLAATSLGLGYAASQAAGMVGALTAVLSQGSSSYWILAAGFLALAALYENWSIPIAVILVVPLGILGALLAATLRGLPNDVFFKVGLLTIVGLSAKNAILIVEFAKDLQAQGKGLIEATAEAAHLRLRPILMTSLAFMLGVLPLAVSTGAGSASRHDIGTGVAGGMITGTVLAVFLVPVFFVVIRRIFKSQKPSHTMLAPKPAGLEEAEGNNPTTRP